MININKIDGMIGGKAKTLKYSQHARINECEPPKATYCLNRC